MNFESLPREIHYLFQESLDHAGLLNFSATNKLFKSMCKKDKIENSLLVEEKLSKLKDTIFTKKGLLPCYICLKGLDASDHFPWVAQNVPDARGNQNEGNRACTTCLLATRPEIISEYWDFFNPGSCFCESLGLVEGGRSKLYDSKYGTREAQNDQWLACGHCGIVKRYKSSKFGRPSRYDEALRVGDMCADCYKPIWDHEDEQKRLRKNARSRRRYKAKKEHQQREAQRMEQAAQNAPN
jgi:hypothetical protein